MSSAIEAAIGLRHRPWLWAGCGLRGVWGGGGGVSDDITEVQGAVDVQEVKGLVLQEAGPGEQDDLALIALPDLIQLATQCWQLQRWYSAVTLSRDQFPLKYMYSQERSHNSPFRVRYGLSVVNSNTNLYPASVTAVLQAISCHSGHVIMALSNIMCTQMDDTITRSDCASKQSQVSCDLWYWWLRPGQLYL